MLKRTFSLASFCRHSCSKTVVRSVRGNCSRRGLYNDRACAFCFLILKQSWNRRENLIELLPSPLDENVVGFFGLQEVDKFHRVIFLIGDGGNGNGCAAVNGCCTGDLYKCCYVFQPVVPRCVVDPRVKTGIAFPSFYAKRKKLHHIAAHSTGKYGSA